MPSPKITAIVLAPYGTLQRKSLSTYNRIRDLYRQEFSESEVRLAFSSDLMRDRLADREGIVFQSPLGALADLHDCGINKAVIQPLQILPGEEFHRLISLLRAGRQVEEGLGFRDLSIGLPLMSSREDCRMVCKGISSLLVHPYPEIECGFKSRHAVVLAGHGSGHPADSLYLTLAQMLQKRHKGVFLGTLEGHPGIDHVMQELEAFQPERVMIIPLFLVCGGHVMKDLAGSGPHSWKSKMQELGIAVDVHQKGLGEMEAILSIFLNHTKEAMNRIR